MKYKVKISKKSSQDYIGLMKAIDKKIMSKGTSTLLFK